MAAVAMLDLLRKNPNFGAQTFISRGLFSAKSVGATSAATSFAIATPFAFGALFRSSPCQVAYCDAGATLGEDDLASAAIAFGEDYANRIRAASGYLLRNDSPKYKYDIQLKPLLSAFHWRTLGLTSLRSFLLFYLPLLEPHASLDEEDEDFLKDDVEEKHLDLVSPFKKSVKQIFRETTVVTTRRVLERLAVHYVSRRMAWKLLKDVPKSAVRKAGRGMPISTYCYCVSKTTFRGHLLGVLASWVVQVGIDVYRFFRSIFKAREENGSVDIQAQVRNLGTNVYGATVRCGSSLVFASIGAGIGVMLFHPSTGQWIGCAVGDLAGPVVVAFCFEKLSLPL